MYCTVSSPAYATRSGKPGGEGSRPLESHHCFRFIIIIIITPSSPLSAGGVALPPRLSKKERKKERKRREQRRSRGWPPSDTRMPPTCTCLRSARRHAGCVRAAGGHPAEPPNHILPGPRARWTPIDPSTSRRGAVRSGAFPPDRCTAAFRLTSVSVHQPGEHVSPARSTHRRVLLGRTEYSERRHNNL